METARHLFDGVVRFLRHGGLWWGVGISVGAAALTLLLGAVVVVGWPVDCFKGEGPTDGGQARSGFVHALAARREGTSPAASWCCSVPSWRCRAFRGRGS